ncbi:heavy metal-associated domain-containing protein [Clostridium sp. 1001271B_151109_B4]|uniref:heavy-metal-associated domain-containing protein n=1 Tax=Clostridium sp. 1001271B_151109_B4 TaxID=2787148 RepID=UPI0018AB13DD|nr:heavy metal-associated domain-containing protein [Clostridium sp. 1001271B_151109_B4]
MKELVRISNLTSHADLLKIRSIVSDYVGVLACEINLNKKEVHLVYDRASISIDEIINAIETSGYMVI